MLKEKGMPYITLVEPLQAQRRGIPLLKGGFGAHIHHPDLRQNLRTTFGG